MASDALGDRMKEYEMTEAGRKTLPCLPILARIDGRCFSNFTRGMDRPYDARMSNLMIATTTYLVQESSACMGYTQSDEITLTWWTDNPKTELFFGGRIQKMVSVLAGMATAYFNRCIQDHFGSITTGELIAKLPHFDCRVWTVPTLEEGANCFLWREYDATKNSIQMAAQSVYSHKRLKDKHGGEMQEMLFQKGINWNDYPDFFKRGSYVQRRTQVRRFTSDEMEKLPPKHEARVNPELEVERTDYRRIDMPPFGRVVNRVGVVYRGEEPLTAGED